MANGFGEYQKLRKAYRRKHGKDPAAIGMKLPELRAALGKKAKGKKSGCSCSGKTAGKVEEPTGKIDNLFTWI